MSANISSLSENLTQPEWPGLKRAGGKKFYFHLDEIAYLLLRLLGNERGFSGGKKS